MSKTLLFGPVNVGKVTQSEAALELEKYAVQWGADENLSRIMGDLIDKPGMNVLENALEWSREVSERAAKAWNELSKVGLPVWVTWGTPVCAMLIAEGIDPDGDIKLLVKLGDMSLLHHFGIEYNNWDWCKNRFVRRRDVERVRPAASRLTQFARMIETMPGFENDADIIAWMRAEADEADATDT